MTITIDVKPEVRSRTGCPGCPTHGMDMSTYCCQSCSKRRHKPKARVGAEDRAWLIFCANRR